MTKASDATNITVDAVNVVKSVEVDRAIYVDLGGTLRQKTVKEWRLISIKFAYLTVTEREFIDSLKGEESTTVDINSGAESYSCVTNEVKLKPVGTEAEFKYRISL